MARILFAPMPITGHVNPGLPIARELVKRGHDVRWYSTHRFERAIEKIGARFVPFEHGTKIDESNLEMFPDRPSSGIAQIRFDIEHLFVAIVPGTVIDLDAELEREPADLVVGDSISVFAAVFAERADLPLAVYGSSALAMPSVDTAPFGLGILPSSSSLGHLRNRVLYWLVDNVIFRNANQRFHAVRRHLKLPRFKGSLFEYAGISDLYMQAGAPSFEYRRSDLIPQLRYIGASVPDPPHDWTPPSWWGDLEGRRVVLLTQGTVNNDFDQLIRPAIRALANEDVLVVVTTANYPPEAIGIDPLPANVRVEQFIPYAHLMPKSSLLLTNGGYGSVQIALAHGVPVMAIGKTEEKPEIANRVSHSGVGIGLKVTQPAEAQIREGVMKILGDHAYRARAEMMRDELAKFHYADTAANLIEELMAEEVAKSA